MSLLSHTIPGKAVTKQNHIFINRFPGSGFLILNIVNMKIVTAESFVI
jgi:hypothetical protein